MSDKHFYITTPIYYVNDRPHIGHAYTSVACDVLARFKRLDGYAVKFLTGTDEHGQKVEKSAKAAGIEPQAFVDMNAQHFREMAKLMNIGTDPIPPPVGGRLGGGHDAGNVSPNTPPPQPSPYGGGGYSFDFIRTTEARHKKSAQALWAAMKDYIYLGKYSGWYAVRDEAYYQESELVNGKAPTGAEVEWVEEPSYFFKLSAFEDKLLRFYDENPEFIGPDSRKNEVISFVKGGLKDLSISRTTFKWGIPVPGDEKHIMYVWLDALANYLSGVGYPDTAAADFKKFWPADLHMVGKDILRFHAVYWPAFLMAADIPCPKRVFAHGWWTIEGEKMSKSLGNVVAPADLVSQFGLDQTRWFLLREVPFGADGNFSRERMVTVINSELANNIGNLVQRTLSMIAKNCDGKIPDYQQGKLRPEDKQFLDSFLVTDRSTPQTVAQQYHDCQFHNIVGDLVKMAATANEYIDRQAPWTLKKTDMELMNAVLYYLAEGIRCLGIFLQPFMPQAAANILDQLAVPKEHRLFSHAYNFDFAASGKLNEYSLKPGTVLPAPQPAFPRFVEKAA